MVTPVACWLVRKFPVGLAMLTPSFFAEDEFNVRLTCLRCKPSELASLVLCSVGANTVKSTSLARC